jgi:hypothetical protein
MEETERRAAVVMSLRGPGVHTQKRAWAPAARGGVWRALKRVRTQRNTHASMARTRAREGRCETREAARVRHAARARGSRARAQRPRASRAEAAINNECNDTTRALRMSQQKNNVKRRESGALHVYPATAHARGVKGARTLRTGVTAPCGTRTRATAFAHTFCGGKRGNSASRRVFFARKKCAVS